MAYTSRVWRSAPRRCSIGWRGEADVAFRGADHTHEVRVIREIPNFVSINSAVEIDLFGQVNAERVGGKQISGTGGSVDFMRAAKASKGGRSIVAMTATARGGSVSRIVPRVDLVTALRTDVDLVVTEYGVADLKHASTRGARGCVDRYRRPGLSRRPARGVQTFMKLSRPAAQNASSKSVPILSFQSSREFARTKQRSSFWHGFRTVLKDIRIARGFGSPS